MAHTIQHQGIFSKIGRGFVRAVGDLFGAASEPISKKERVDAFTRSPHSVTSVRTLNRLTQTANPNRIGNRLDTPMISFLEDVTKAK